MDRINRKSWSLLLLGWAVGLWSVWAVLNWFPFVGFDSPLTNQIATAGATLFVVAWALDQPTERMARGLTLGFALMMASSVALMLNKITSFGFTAAALAGLLAYWHRLDRLAGTDESRLLRAKHAMGWMLFAPLLEGAILLAALVMAMGDGQDALGTAYVIGFIWLNLSIFGGMAGHQFHEGSRVEGAKAPILWVFFLPWSIGVATFIVDIAGQHRGQATVWGMLAAMAMSGWAAFHNRRLILRRVFASLPDRGNGRRPLSYTAKDRLITGAGIAGGINMTIGLLLNPKINFADAHTLSEGLSLALFHMLFFFIAYAVTRRLACTLMVSGSFERWMAAVIALACIPWATSTYAPVNYAIALSSTISVVVLGILRGDSARGDRACNEVLSSNFEFPGSTPSNREET